MKKTLLKIITASLFFALPMTIASCDGSDSSSNSSNSDITEIDENIDDGNDDTPIVGDDCLEGKTYQFIGTQTTTTETTSPIASTTTTELNYDFVIEFMTGGVSKITGTLDVVNINVNIAGINTNVTAGLGTIDVDQMGTYDCPIDLIDPNQSEFTVVEGGITTVYTLTFTSVTSGTYTANVSGTQDGATINASSSGSFTIL